MQTYAGSCHCGAVRFEVTANLDKASTCNCSICARTSWVMTMVPPEQFRLLAGAERLADYQFGAKTTHHHFCPTCGIRPFGRWNGEGGEKVIVNLRCVDGIDLRTLPTEEFDGKSY